MLSAPLNASLLILAYLQAEEPNIGDVFSKDGAILRGGEAVWLEGKADGKDPLTFLPSVLLFDIFRSLQKVLRILLIIFGLRVLM